MMTSIEQAKLAKKAVFSLAKLSEEQRNDILKDVAQRFLNQEALILLENQKDIEQFDKDSSLKDRLMLNHERIVSMAEGIEQVAGLQSNLYQKKEHRILENGLDLTVQYVPLGTVGLIYEARPNVTADGFALCFKTANSVVLRGGSDAYCSNRILVQLIKDVLREHRVDEHAVELILDRTHQSVADMLKMRGILDVIVPRGGASLINRVVKESWVPVIETGAGNCFLYVDEEVDVEMALSVIENAKCQRVSVCNALESLVVHKKQMPDFLDRLIERIIDRVELRVEEQWLSRNSNLVLANELDWESEYLDYKLSLKVVDNLEEAVNHINRYHTMHSDGILTTNDEHAEYFCSAIDSAVVYVNASTRFSDGYEFGLGAELGISTQKLHARGPMGLNALLTTKTIIKGKGQVR